MKLKICGLRRVEDIQAVNTWQPDYIGFVFAASKRQVTGTQAVALKALLAPQIAAVGVFANNPIPEIVALVTAGIIDLVQLHGTEDAAYLTALRRQLGKDTVPIIQAIGVSNSTDLQTAQQTTADYILLDTATAGQYGGSGQCFDWNHLTAVHRPYFLAGGINAANIHQALVTDAFCLDVSSGAETNGWKDSDKIRELVEFVRQHDRS